MKKITLLTALMAFLFMGIQGSAQKKNSETVYFKSNMHCAACENKVFEMLRFEKGVKDLKVDHISNTVKVVYATGKSSSEKLVKAIEKEGYEAKEIAVEEYTKIVESAKGKPAVKETHSH